MSTTRSLGALLRFRPVEGEAGFLPLPPIELAESEDEAEQSARAELLGYEVEPSYWGPISCGGTPSHLPVRFVDGSVVSQTVGVVDYDTVYRPLLLASLGALELVLDGRRLCRPERGWHCQLSAALIVNRIPGGLVDALRSQLKDMGINLIALQTDDYGPNYEVLRRRTWDFLKNQMEAMERDLLLARPDVPTVADGLLERRLTTLGSQRQPVVGMVKRNLRQYLPNAQAALLYELKHAERSPAFVIRTPHAELVSWYLRLSGGPINPGAGLVRLAMPREYLECSFPWSPNRHSEISAISSWICSLRCRQESYPRHRVSLEPMVRLEDELHALIPRVEQHAGRVKLRLRA